MASTTPDGIAYPVSTDQISPLESVFATQASSVQNALLARFKNVPYPVGSASARDAAIPSPVAGNAVWRTDLEWEERYFTTTPVAGWYPVAGRLPAYSARSDSDSFAATAISAGGTTLPLPSTVSLNRGFTVNAGAGTITIITPGIYSISGSLRMISTPTALGIQINGTSIAVTYTYNGGSGASYGDVAVNGVRLAAGDVVSFNAVATSAQAAQTTQRHHSVAYISAA